MEKYTKIMEHIYPTQEQKNKMLENAYQLQTEKQRKFKFRLRYCIPALALSVVLSTTVFAEEIKNTFYGLLGKNEIVAEEVLNDVYTDTDGHVTMAVKEVLSDKITSYVILEYTACDDKGKKWLDNYLTVHQMNMPSLSPNVYEGVSGYYYSSNTEKFEEQLDLRTENTRVFKVIFSDPCENIGTSSFKLIYPLSTKWENHGLINVEDSIKCTDIRFDNTKAPEKYYKPMGVKISPLSIMIYGKDMGMVDAGPLPGGGSYMHVVHDENIDSLYLLMKDGTRQNLLETDKNYFGLSRMWYYESLGQDYDCTIYCSYFDDYMDLSTIDGIELDGVYYPLS